MCSLRLCVCVLFGCGVIAAPLQAAEPATAEPTKRALLIGCARYVHLPRKYHLRGPANDVTLTATLLRDSFQFPEEHVVMLTDGRGDDARPYYAHIVREFERLIEAAGPGDDVFILLAGHGSQQPDDADDPDELDGLDEVFLPADIPAWESSAPIVKGITDDQIGQWLDAIRDKGAFVFFVADACHSGTMSRGPEDFQTRHVPPELLTPPDQLERATSRARGPVVTDEEQKTATPDAPATGLTEATGLLDSGRGGLVALYAVPDNRLEIECPMPPPSASDRDQTYGRLSYALNTVLTRVTEPISYQELAQQLRWQYEEWEWYPTSRIEGSDLTRAVLGADDVGHRSDILLQRQPGGELGVDSGLLRGMTEGSILAVYPPAGRTDSDQLQGYVRVTRALPTRALVEPCDFEDRPASGIEELPFPGRCDVAYLNLQEERLTVDVRPLVLTADELALFPDLAAAEPASVSRIREIVGELAADENSLVRLADSPAPADMYLLVAESGVMLRRSGDPVLPSEQTAAGLFGPYDIDEGLPDKLQDALRRLSRAIRLRRLAASEQTDLTTRLFGSQVAIDVLIEKVDLERETFTPIDDPGTIELTDGDVVRVTVTNQGRLPVDVTILYIQSDARIISFFPPGPQAGYGFDNRILRGGDPAQVAIPLNDETVGLEDIIVIATVGHPAGEPQNFAFLQQDGLQRSRAMTRGNPLQELLDTAAYGSGQRGGGNPRELSDFAIRRLSWKIVKKQELPVPEQ